MSITAIQDAIGMIRDFPYADVVSGRMVRVLTQHAAMFDAADFQFTVSMGCSLNDMLDDGIYGVRDADQPDHGWFVFAPIRHGESFLLRTGFGSQVFAVKESSEDTAGALLGDGIRHLIANSRK
jgi:hypothetical protein